MSKLDLFFTVVFIVFTTIAVILIYLYNKRYKNYDDEPDYSFEIKEQDSKVAYDENEDFGWKLYEDDLNYNVTKFMGSVVWENKKTAEKRIKELKDEFEKDNSKIILSMFETMLFVDKYGEDIKLDENGIYRTEQIHLYDFIHDLEYDIPMIETIERLKEQIGLSMEHYDVDIKKVFYIMRNAKAMGIYNIKNNSQFFMFAKENNNKIIDSDFINELQNNQADIEIQAVKMFDKEEDEEKRNKKIKKLQERVEKFSSRFSKSKDEEGNTIIEFPNGKKFIKNGLWDIQQIEEKEDNSYIQIEEESISDIAEKVNKKQSDVIQKENKPDVTEELIKTNFLGIRQYAINSGEGKKSIIGYFGEINNYEEYNEIIEKLNVTELNSILAFIFSIKSSRIKIEDFGNVSFIHMLNGDYYISYDYIAYILLLMIENRDSFAIENNIIKGNLVISYPVQIVQTFFDKVNKDLKNVFVKETEKIYSYQRISLDETRAVALTNVKLGSLGKETVKKFNSQESQDSIKSDLIDTKTKFTKYEHKVSFNFSLIVKNIN